MIYLPYIIGEINFKIPVNLSKSMDSNYRLHLFNTVTRNEYTQDVTDTEELLNYYSVSFEFTQDMEQGEYEYKLYDSQADLIFARGLIRYGTLRDDDSATPGTEINNTYKYPSISYGTEA